MLTWSIVLITVALIIYTIAVWTLRAEGRLQWIHAALFGVGFACDLAANVLMAQLARESSLAPASALGQALGAIMTVTGLIAVVLMGLQVVAAVVVLLRNREEEARAFPRFSMALWAFWLIPYVTGAASTVVG